MSRRRAAVLAISGAGLLAAAASAAPLDAPGAQQAAARMPALTQAYYHVEVEYDGLRSTRQNTIIGGEFIRAASEVREGEYRAATRRPARLISYCVGPHVRHLPRALRRSPGACAEIRRRALALLEGRRRFNFIRTFNRLAREAYAFGGPGRSITLRGEVTDSAILRSERPISMFERGDQGRPVRVTCSRDTRHPVLERTPLQRTFGPLPQHARETIRKQLGAQQGLVIRLLSGRARPPTGASVAARRTTQGGIQLISSVEGGPGVAPGRYDETTTAMRCPGADGGAESLIPGNAVTGATVTWFPLDRIVRVAGDGRPEERLRFTRPPGRLGRPFTKTDRIFTSKLDDPSSSRLQTRVEGHDWKLTFTPCRNPATPRRC